MFKTKAKFINKVRDFLGWGFIDILFGRAWGEAVEAEHYTQIIMLIKTN